MITHGEKFLRLFCKTPKSASPAPPPDCGGIPPMAPESNMTGLLRLWHEGDAGALEQLAPLIEQELHRIAHLHMRRENPGHPLQTTALVNEAFIRLLDQKQVQWQNRMHFFALASSFMRRILINYARNQNRVKRGGGGVVNAVIASAVRNRPVGGTHVLCMSMEGVQGHNRGS
ncbi:MAG: ECF-type sigma factor [Blastocatellia bacterium]